MRIFPQTRHVPCQAVRGRYLAIVDVRECVDGATVRDEHEQAQAVDRGCGDGRAGGDDVGAPHMTSTPSELAEKHDHPGVADLIREYDQ